ncbi:MAG: DUF2207 domain-containing protein [Maricaulaceae bacterium]
MRCFLSIFTLIVTSFILSFTAAAQNGGERILSYDVKIDVQKDADFIITERISVRSEGRAIRRGIFRDLPRFKLDEGTPIPYRYTLMSVTRNGNPEKFEESAEDNAERIRIGRANYFLPRGRHDYEIVYEVKNEVRYQDGFDEVYWNITGNYWAFPIDVARAEIIFPDGTSVLELNGYTGPFGATGKNYTARRLGNRALFETQTSLQSREGLSVSVTIPKGIIDPPSVEDIRWLWWAKNGALALLTLSLLGIFGYYYLTWSRIGRDPAKQPVFPRYAPPKGYSAAGLHYVYNRGLKGNNALIATFISLSIAGFMRIDKPSKRKTHLIRLAQTNVANLHPDDADLFNQLFLTQAKVKLDGKYNSRFATVYQKSKTFWARKYGKTYHQWNVGHTVLGVFVSVAAVFISLSHVHKAPSQWVLLGLAVLIAMNLLFVFLMPAPTKKGQAIRAEIEGFKLYLETAESLQINAVDIHSDAPPPLTQERYERFLPYAIALGEEKPWTKYFERTLPDMAQNYDPSWTSLNRADFRSFSSMTNSISSGLSSGVSSAAVQPSSNSGNGGGGFSGGGGGGGGGGGW